MAPAHGRGENVLRGLQRPADGGAVVIAAVAAARRAPTIVPVWLRVPGHCDIAEVADEDLVGELRRRGYAVFELGRDLELPGLVVRGGASSLVWRGREVGLSAREADVLRVLAAAWPGPVTSRALLRAIWGLYAEENLPRMYVRYLRRKAPGLIETLQPNGAGYRLALEENGHA